MNKQRKFAKEFEASCRRLVERRKKDFLKNFSAKHPTKVTITVVATRYRGGVQAAASMLITPLRNHGPDWKPIVVLKKRRRRKKTKA